MIKGMEKLQELDMPKSRGGKQEDERRSSYKGITKNSSKYKLPMYQLELEAGQGKKNCFHAYQHETLDQSSRESSWDRQLSVF